MSCAACSARVEKAVAKVAGVQSCSVSLLTNSMGVEGDVPDSEIIRAVENAGYGASLKASVGASGKENAGSKVRAAGKSEADRLYGILSESGYGYAGVCGKVACGRFPCPGVGRFQ